MYLYENSIIKDINSLFTNSKVKAVIADSLDEGLRRSAAEGEDKITLPFIVLSGGDWRIKETNFYSLMHGTEFMRTEEGKLAKAINILPVEPSYTMYIAASSSRECDMLTREILFHYSMHPTLVIDIPYNIDNIHTFNINFSSTIRKYQRQNGLVYRTIEFVLDGAYLWHNNTMNVIKETNVEVEERIETDFGKI
nr:hypothetical protein DGKKSRWO_DGKKSRWO_CDS_0196 [uncultured phage]CAI9752374.1 hypothetical protein CVNMHQAP_CVNMHQAP_CDS_0197 [uncultured phage]